MKLTQSVVGTTSTINSIRDLSGSGKIPIQAELTGAFEGTWRLLGRVDPSAPWREILASSAAGSLQSLAYFPYLQLEVLTKTMGATEDGVTLWIGEF